MVKVDLDGVYQVTSKGRTYTYAWRGRGAPRLFARPGSPEFVQELSDALESRKDTGKGTLAWLCMAYRKSPEYEGLAASTKKQWAVWLSRIQDHFGTLSIRQFDRPVIRVAIRKWRDRWSKTPRTADYGLQVLSRLTAFAVAEGHLASNPCIGIPRLYRANRAELIWSNDDLEKLASNCSPEINWAARLAALTGIRQGDLLRLTWAHVHPNSIEFETGKGRRHGRRVVVPLYDELRQLLATIPKRSITVLTNSDGKPWKSGFGSSWNKALRRAGLNLHFHDLRGTAATRFYRVLENREIAEILGWSEKRVERLIDVYVRKDQLLKDRIERLNQNAS